MKRLMLLAAVVAVMLPYQAAARGRFGVFVGPRLAPYGWYGGWNDPYFYGPYAYGGYAVAPNTGEVKLETHAKDAQVFVNGSYAGTAGKLKTMRLRPGTYTIELRAPGHARYAEKIYVIAGKKIVLNPDIRPAEQSLR